MRSALATGNVKAMDDWERRSEIETFLEMGCSTGLIEVLLQIAVEMAEAEKTLRLL